MMRAGYLPVIGSFMTEIWFLLGSFLTFWITIFLAARKHNDLQRLSNKRDKIQQYPDSTPTRNVDSEDI